MHKARVNRRKASLSPTDLARMADISDTVVVKGKPDANRIVMLPDDDREFMVWANVNLKRPIMAAYVIPNTKHKSLLESHGYVSGYRDKVNAILFWIPRTMTKMYVPEKKQGGQPGPRAKPAPVGNGFNLQIAKRIQELRIEKGWTQTDLANKLGIVKTAISEMEKGQSMSLKRIETVFEALGHRIVFTTNPVEA